jgi:hypothetical protein
MPNPPRITDAERSRARKLFAQGKNKADIARIMGRGRKIIIKILKGNSAPGARQRPTPQRRQPKKPVMRWWLSPKEAFAKSSPSERIIADALGD